MKTKDYADKYRAEYKKLRPLRCPEVNNEWVGFTSDGLNHLMFKGRHRRKTSDLKYRLKLVPLIKVVIKQGTLVEERKKKETVKGVEKWVCYYSLSANDIGKSKARVNVILRRQGDNGKLHFYSIMKK